MLNLRNIEAFLAVCAAGSFTQAAKRLQKTQSSVSQAVRLLEEELGVILIDRDSRHVTLTPAGQLLRSRASSIVEDIDAMASLVREQGTARIRELRFGLVDSFASAVGPELIRGMLDEAVNLSIWSELTPHLGEALLARRVDIIVANDPFDGTSGLVRHELLREPFLLLLPTTIAWDPAAPDLPTLSRNIPMIRYQAMSRMGALIDAQCHRLNMVPARKVTVDSTEKLVAMVAAGIGWTGGTPIALLRAPAYRSGIQVMPFPGEPFERRLFMIARRGEHDQLVARLARRAREVLTTLVDGELRRLVPRFWGQIHITPDNDADQAQDRPASVPFSPDFGRSIG